MYMMVFLDYEGRVNEVMYYNQFTHQAFICVILGKVCRKIGSVSKCSYPQQPNCSHWKMRKPHVFAFESLPAAGHCRKGKQLVH